MPFKKTPMVHVNMRLPDYVVDHFKQFPNFTKEMRRVLEEHTNEVQDAEAAHVAIDQQRWQDILAEEDTNA
tara:strand:- start:514 stop:726 length:213 start_codon:yes stop_codon:yes gene_type:complete